MNLKHKRFWVLALCLIIVFSLTGCSSKWEKTYQNYVKSLIAINYLGATEDYVKATGANQADADALYEENMEHLADNILAYYDVTISDVSGAKQGYIDLAKNIYSKINYKVDKAVESNGVYTVDVTIYPINIFAQTNDAVIAYVDKFNQDVAAGVYNDYTMEQYETEFSNGLLAILNDACLNMTYADPVVITVTIVED
ncbi:MAG: hypothetical protein J6A25_10805, partial [Lachnospiraceae bacterium]|nr:hypothetical protein [Lachnospiraceae bacterium]